MRFGKKQRKPDSKVLLSGGHTGSRFTEAYRTLRTNIHFSCLDRAFQSLVITSTTQEEGKTVTVANLGHTISRSGNTVLMVDADLRKPSLGKIVSEKESVGITGILFDLFNTAVNNGDIEDIGTGDLIALLVLQKKSGTLRLECGDEKIEVLFIGGKPLNIHGENSSGKLENILNNEQPGSDKYLLPVAYQRHKDNEEMKAALEAYAIEEMQAVSRMKNGNYFFDRLPATDLKRVPFIPAELQRLYEQNLIESNDTPWLSDQIDSAILETGTQGLFLLQSGELPPDPSELLGSNRMDFLVSHLKRRYDFLIFDTPPLQPASDALLLAPQTDGVVLIVKSGGMNRELIKKVVERLKMARANLLGVVLNKTDPRKDTYYKYDKYYSYGEK